MTADFKTPDWFLQLSLQSLSLYQFSFKKHSDKHCAFLMRFNSKSLITSTHIIKVNNITVKSEEQGMLYVYIIINETHFPEVVNTAFCCFPGDEQ